MQPVTFTVKTFKSESVTCLPNLGCLDQVKVSGIPIVKWKCVVLEQALLVVCT